jgi:putative DNA primase/helicase
MKPDLHGLGVGRHRLPCPDCDKGPRDDALSIEVRDDGSAVWLCWRCQASGGMRGERTFTAHTKPRTTVPSTQAAPRNAFAAARDIWRHTQPIAGTLGEDYLHLRHCATPPTDGDLRFHASLYCPEVERALPALVARVTTVIGNKAIGIHRIWIREGESKAVKKMRLGGSDEPVCIRLWPEEDVTLGLGIAEGVETALAAGSMFKPMWATIDAGQMAKFPLVPGLEFLTIFADYDKAGLAASKAVWLRYLRAGVNANHLRPQRVGDDINDMVLRADAELEKAQA